MMIACSLQKDNDKWMHDVAKCIDFLLKCSIEVREALSNTKASDWKCFKKLMIGAS